MVEVCWGYDRVLAGGEMRVLFKTTHHAENFTQHIRRTRKDLSADCSETSVSVSLRK
jgi:hypothetical protein